jgi:uracil phosphoribosyltransferase
MAYEVTRDLPHEEIEVELPTRWPEPGAGRKKLALDRPARRTGMVDGIQKLLPMAKVRPYRPVPDPRTLSCRIYCKLPPDSANATDRPRPHAGYRGSASAAVAFLKKRASHIKIMSDRRPEDFPAAPRLTPTCDLLRRPG